MLPFTVAAILNTLDAIARPMHWYAERFDGYCFLFAIPWAWLLERGSLGVTHNRFLDTILAAWSLCGFPPFFTRSVFGWSSGYFDFVSYVLNE